MKIQYKCVIKYRTSDIYNIIKQFLKISLREIQRQALCPWNENILLMTYEYFGYIINLFFDRRRKTEARPVESGGFQSAQWMAKGTQVKPF